MKHSKLILQSLLSIGLLGLLLSSVTAHAEIYRWLDKEGIPQFSSIKPPLAKGEYQEIESTLSKFNAVSLPPSSTFEDDEGNYGQYDESAYITANNHEQSPNID